MFMFVTLRLMKLVFVFDKDGETTWCVLWVIFGDYQMIAERSSNQEVWQQR